MCTVGAPAKTNEKSPLLHLVVRPSQKKYNLPQPDAEQSAIEILSVSKPGNAGYLSQMYVPLLWQRGVTVKTFEELACEAFMHHVERIVEDEEFALFSILRMQKKWSFCALMFSFQKKLLVSSWIM